MNLKINFKSVDKKQKIGIGFGVIVVIVLIYFLFSLVNNKDISDKASQAFENNEKNAIYQKPPLLSDSNGSDIYDSEAFFKMQQNVNQKSDLDKTKDDIENKIIDISQAEQIKQKQAEMMKKLEKMQRPSDMIAFLKSIQPNITLLTYNNSFKYDYKEYKVGDKLLDFFYIEEIAPIFIRFADTQYSYNLRFLKEE